MAVAKLRVILTEGLVDEHNEPRYNPGAKVVVVGILKDLPLLTKSGAETVDSEYILEAVHIENTEEEEVDLKISDEEMETFKKISSDYNYIETLSSSLAPSIYGHDKIKEALLLQIVGGTKKIKDDGTVKRGNIHLLLIGDPGVAKSQLIKRIEKLIPQSRTANGKGASGVGLTAAVVRDDFIGWTFQAGTLVLAHRSLAIIDEFDKMSKEDRDQIHEAMEQQTVTISKAGVQARLRCECALLAAANPKYGRFDPHLMVAEQINLPPTLINRFDLIFPLRDVPEESRDKKLAEHILAGTLKNSFYGCELDTSLIRKYLFLAKTYTPYLSKGAINRLVQYYLQLRQSSKAQNGIKAVPISARQLDGLQRLSESYAKLRLSNEVSEDDAERAIEIMNYYLQEVAFDSETGTVDIDRIALSTPSARRQAVSIVRQVMKELEQDSGDQVLKMDDIVFKALEQKLNENKIADTIKYMKKMGDIFEPKKGFIARR